ncbi:MAG: hypothetical protein IIB42_06510 [Candidatus Marinimicrobia bacterium]|nr:hypothetical protein [Candidatus Neomarinimicrobiota bacterium]
MQMINPQSKTGKSELEKPAPLFFDLADMAPEHQIWFRRKVYLKVAMFLVSFVGVALVMLMLI